MTLQTAGRGLLALATTFALGTASAAPQLGVQTLWTQSGAGAEIVAVDTASNRVFNTTNSGVEVRDLTTGNLIGTFTVPNTSGVQSVAVKNGVVAVAAGAQTLQTDPGTVAFFNANEANPNSAAPINSVTVGALPDMLTFTPDGNRVLVANEGEADGGIDPVGSVSIIDLSGGVGSASVNNLGFGGFNAAAIEADGGRIFESAASVAQDLEPEYIAVSPDGATAFVGLQENNAVAKIDILAGSVEEIQGLGFKDHSLPGNELDASDDDGIIGNLQNWPLFGMYQPDGMDAYSVGGQLYYVTANEGDSRDEDDRIKDLTLDLVAFPDAATLADDDQLGRLEVSTIDGDTDSDGDFDELYSYGARSFSIWDEDGNLVYDSGSLIESIIATQFPDRWQENRSDNKGPEPEAIEIVEFNNWYYALVGLERTDGFMIFDITDPNAPVYQDYILTLGDEAPEGIAFAQVMEDSSGGWGYLAVANEESQTVTLYRVEAVSLPAPALLMLIGVLALRRARARR